MKKTDINLYKILKEVINKLPKKRRMQLYIFCIITAIAALLEVLAVGTIAFFASSVSSPETVLSSRYIAFVREEVGIYFLDSPASLIVTLSIAVVAVVLAKNALQGFLVYWVSRFSALIEAYFGEKLLKGFLHIPYEWHIKQNSADLVLAVQWRMFLGRLFITPCLYILNDAMVVLFMLFALIVVQPFISLILIIVLGSAGFLIFTFVRRYLDKTASFARNYEKTINKESTKAIHGIKDVKISRKEAAFVDIFKKYAYPYSKIFSLQQALTRMPVLLMETVGFMMLVLSICIMLFWMDASPAKVTGTIALLAVTAWRVLPAVTRILSSTTAIRNYLPYVKTELDYLAVIDKYLKHVKTGIIQKEVLFEKDIEFKGVYFAYQQDYEKKYVLKNINLTIPKGKTAGIIGTSGAGKSTLVDILIGLLTPTGGKVLIDGVELNDETRPAWLKKTGYVPQSPYIYDGTLAENIAFGYQGDEIDRDKVLKVCKMAAIDFLKDLPDGIDTQIGERGIKLSGGQRQRVAIARALYLEPEVMIFDEATSSLDTKSEKAIQDTIYNLKGNQTLIIIAHRLSTVKDCDFLVWIEKGEVKMIGEPDEVLERYEGKQLEQLKGND